jgi:hypothetical protein
MKALFPCLFLSFFLLLTNSKALASAPTDPDETRFFCPPVVGTDLGPDRVICGAYTDTLSPTFSGSSGPYSYLWSTGDTTPLIVVPAGTYSVTVSAPGYTPDADTVVLMNSSMPPLQFNSGIASACAGQSISVMAPMGYLFYQWSTGATGPVLTINNSGVYTLTVIDSTYCVSTDTLTAIYPSPPASILGNDTMICPDTFAVLHCAPFSSYLWTNGATTQTIMPSNPGSYEVIVTDIYGCVYRDTANVTINPDCIWPGDANHDGVANNLDILDIGFAMGGSGAARLNPGFNWYGQVANNWAQNFPSLLNYKHADCDGDGLVAFQDTSLVMQNYGLTHNKADEVSSGPALQFQPLQSNYVVGDVVRIGIYLGDQGNSAVGMGGVAFSVNVGGVATNPGDVWFSFPNSFMGSVGVDAFGVAFEDVAAGQHDLALTTLMGASVSGYGLIAILNLRTDSTMLPNGHNPLTFSVANATLVDGSLQALLISSVPMNLDLLAPNVLGVPNQQTFDLQMYPVPADQWLHVRCETQAGPMEVQLFDLAGQRCKRISVSYPVTDLPVGDLSEGTYLMQVVKAGHVISRKKITILHR